MGEQVFVQYDDRNIDGYKSLRERAEGNELFAAELGKGKKANADIARDVACKEWIDVRNFGQVFAFKGYVQVLMETIRNI